MNKETEKRINEMLKALHKNKITTEEIEQTIQIVELAQLLNNEQFQINEAEVDDYNSVIFSFRIGKYVWDITMYSDYTFDIQCNLQSYQMCDAVYNLMKDLFTQIRFQVYHLHDEKKLASDADDDFDYSEELIELGLDDDSDDSFCYVFN